MRLWRIWYSRNEACNWLIQDSQTEEIFKVNHVDIRVSSRTEESARQRGSCPPPFVILAEGELEVVGMDAVISHGREDSCI
jgi:hypothetical protein